MGSLVFAESDEEEEESEIEIESQKSRVSMVRGSLGIRNG